MSTTSSHRSVSLPRTDASAVLILPLHSSHSLEHPSIYVPIIRRITARTTSSLLIYFHGSALSSNPSWRTIDRFLSIVYSAAAQEAVKYDRVLMNVNVLMQGFAVDAHGKRGGKHGRVEGKWDRVWVAENEEDGEEDKSRLVEILQHLPDAEYISTFPSQSISSPLLTAKNPIIDDGTVKNHEEDILPVIAAGGTFDHLHAGHKILLSMCVWLSSRKIIIGISDDPLLKHKSYPSWLEPLSIRVAHVRTFLSLLNPRLELNLVPLNDVCGPTGTESDIQGLVVSRESASGGDTIAKVRQDGNLPPLKQYTIDVITSTSPISTPADPEEKEGHVQAPASLVGERDADKLKVLKMGSTYIREWLSQRVENGKD